MGNNQLTLFKDWTYRVVFSLLIMNVWHSFLIALYSIHVVRQQVQMIILPLRVLNPVNMVLIVPTNKEFCKHNPKVEVSMEWGKHTYFGEIAFHLFPFSCYIQGHFLSW